MDGTTQLSAEDLMGWSKARELASQQGKILVRTLASAPSPPPSLSPHPFSVLAGLAGKVKLMRALSDSHLQGQSCTVMFSLQCSSYAGPQPCGRTKGTVAVIRSS